MRVLKEPESAISGGAVRIVLSEYEVELLGKNHRLQGEYLSSRPQGGGGFPIPVVIEVSRLGANAHD